MLHEFIFVKGTILKIVVHLMSLRNQIIAILYEKLTDIFQSVEIMRIISLLVNKSLECDALTRYCSSQGRKSKRLAQMHSLSS